MLTCRAERGARGALVDRVALAALVTADLCGDAASCDAVRSTLRDEQKTSLERVRRIGVGRRPAERGRERARAVASREGRPCRGSRASSAVRVAMPTGPGSSRCARRFAAGGNRCAREAEGRSGTHCSAHRDGARVREARRHDVRSSEPCFRRDRVELLTSRRTRDVVRMLTSGLSRWGAPDVEAAAVPTAAAPRIADVVLGVAVRIANGATAGPGDADARRHRARARAAVSRGRGASGGDSGGHGRRDRARRRSGDPSDFIARIVPRPARAHRVPRSRRALLRAHDRGSGAGRRRARRAARCRAGAASRPRSRQWEAAKAGGATLLVQCRSRSPATRAPNRCGRGDAVRRAHRDREGEGRSAGRHRREARGRGDAAARAGRGRGARGPGGAP